MGANRTARTRPAKTEDHALRPGISSAIYLIACSAYSAYVSGTFYANLQHTEISTCTMQVQPGPAGNRPPTHHCGTPPAAPIRKRCQATPPRPPGPRPALAMCSAAARVGQHGGFGAKRYSAGCATAWCANDPARAAAGFVPRPPHPFGDNAPGAPAAAAQIDSSPLAIVTTVKNSSTQ